MRGWPTLAIAMVALCALGCKTTQPPRTSRIAVDDYLEMTAAMAQSLRQSDAFAQRSAESEPWIVSFDKVLNLSSEIMTQGEQWGVIAMVRGAQPIDSLWDDTRVAFVIPAQYAIDQRGTLEPSRPRPTARPAGRTAGRAGSRWSPHRGQSCPRAHPPRWTCC